MKGKNYKIKSMYFKQELGKIGELFARTYLEENEYEIVETNFICKQGEIDIIASKNKELIFIEVKTRGQDNFGKPIEAVTDSKKRHIYKVAEYFIFVKKLIDVNIRFDVIEVYTYHKQVLKLVHTKNAIIE